MRKLNATLLTFLIFPLLVFGQSTQSKICIKKDEGNILEREICDYKYRDETTIASFLENDLSALFSLVNVPLGISLAFEDFNDNRVNQNFIPRSFVIKDLIDQITNTDSRYQWKEENGVINLFPKDDYSILETRISEFKVDNEYSWKIDERIVQTKEFQQYLKEKNLIDRIPDPENKYGFTIIGAVGKPNHRDKISVDLKNATIREILNEIVRKKGHGAWIYREYNLISDGKFYQMYRLTS